MYAKPASLLAIALVAASRIAPAAPPPLIIVNSTADTIANDGFCTLREAIHSATQNVVSGNMPGECAAGTASPAVDTITFGIPGTDAGCSGGICTIALSSPLPDITEPVFINGYSQANASANSLAVGDNAAIRIRIDASGMSGTPLNLAGGSDLSTVNGLSIVKPGGDANNLSYLMAISSSGNTVAGNFIGVEPDGTTVSTNHVIFAALRVAASSNTIGGTAPAARNLIADINLGNSHALDMDGGTSNLVEGNYFDLDATGTVAIGSAVIAVNVATGGNTIGGSAAGAGNVIGTWGTVGLQFAWGAPASAVVAKGNRIGTDATGTVPLAVGTYGIFVGNTNGSVTIGGGAAGEGNVIRGAQNHLRVFGNAALGNTFTIQGNHFGLCADGASPSATSGINIDNSNVAGLIGGTTAGERNEITCSGTNGVSIATAIDWAILGNSIHDNGFGISLAGTDGISPPTPNDTNDADTGPNNRQNYPVLNPGMVGPKTTVAVSGSLNSEANKTYRLEFFANAGCDKSGHGQGKIFVGTTDVTTNPNGVAFGPLALTTPIDRHVITATATDPDGNTSEFSDCSGDDTIFTDGLEGD